jgi:2-oxoisovalerate dehydrogenase E1 component
MARAAESPMSPTEAVDRGFRDFVAALAAAPRSDPDAALAGGRLTGRQLLALFDDQMRSRHLDLAARAMREAGAGYYTIGSSGHEGNAALAEALRAGDPALLHYRSCAFFLARARKAGYGDAARDVLLGCVAARDEPIAGGRHKIIGSRALWIPPQTSTIASHLPKAMGMAFALQLARHLRLLDSVPHDAIVVCSFGDASLNHSTAQGAINAAAWAAHQHLPTPILFVCEDNGVGISVATPAGWIARAASGIRRFHADGTDLVATYEAALDAAAYVRQTRAPAFLHLEVTRLLGHAGSDVELGYRTLVEIRAGEERDPLRRSAVLAVAAGLCEPADILDRYEAIRAEVRALADEVRDRPGLLDGADVMAPIAPRSTDRVRVEATRAPLPAERERLFGGRLPEREPPGTLAQQIGRALLDLMARYPGLIVFGEDVAKKGGVYGVTRGLRDRAGSARVFDTLLDEQSILGVAQGAGQLGLLPVPEIQYLAYLHNAEDQLRGEAATLQFFSRSQFRCPMILRIAAYAYQKGFGGHFHNDNAVGVLRDIPGLVVASPALGDDAAAMLRTCAAAAQVDGAVCVFLEPIALYHERDLHEPGDGGLTTRYPGWDEHVPLGRARVHGDGTDLTMISFANGLRMSLRAARRLAGEGIACRVVDLRWLAPLPVDDILAAAAATGRVLVVDETRASGGVSEGIVTALVDAGHTGRIRRVASKDSFVPLGPAAAHVLLGEEEIVRAARELVRG